MRTSRDFARANDHCANGSPYEATAEKGAKYIELASERISAFLVELAKAEIDETFPHTAAPR